MNCADCPHLDRSRMPADWEPRDRCCLTADSPEPPPPPAKAYPEVPPVRVSSSGDHPDFHPHYFRIGVMVDGVRRPDVSWYDADAGRYRCGRGGQVHDGQVVVFWLTPENRQQRRDRERWDAKHPQPLPRHKRQPEPVEPVEPVWTDPAPVDTRAIASVPLAAAALALAVGGLGGIK